MRAKISHYWTQLVKCCQGPLGDWRGQTWPAATLSLHIPKRWYQLCKHHSHAENSFLFQNEVIIMRDVSEWTWAITVVQVWLMVSLISIACLCFLVDAGHYSRMEKESDWPERWVSWCALHSCEYGHRIQGEKKAGRLSGFIQSVRKRGIFSSCLS